MNEQSSDRAGYETISRLHLAHKFKCWLLRRLIGKTKAADKEAETGLRTALEELERHCRWAITGGWAALSEQVDSHVRSNAARSRLKRLISGPGERALLQSDRELLLAIDRTIENGSHPQYEELEKLAGLLRDGNAAFDLFWRDFSALFQERLHLKVLGFGEISTVLGISGGRTLGRDGAPGASCGWVYKKMPPFPSPEAVREYEALYIRYRLLLVDELGIAVPRQKIYWRQAENGTCTVYAVQEKQDPDTLGQRLIRPQDARHSATMLIAVLGELKKVAEFNRNGEDLAVAVDGQISNWAFTQGLEPEGLIYVDTSTPLMRVDGEEQLDVELFLKTTPTFLRAMIRAFFLQDVLDRYYDLRRVTIDIIANFYKEGFPEHIPTLIETANEFFSAHMDDFRIEAITTKEVRSYYREDAFIWRFFQFARRVDRFVIERILRKTYEYRLPGPISR